MIRQFVGLLTVLSASSQSCRDASVTTTNTFGSRFQAGSISTAGVFKPFVATTPNWPTTGVTCFNTAPAVYPTVLVASAPATYFYTSNPAVQQQPSEVNVHPGDEPAAVRYATPTSGTYRVRGQFRTLDSQTTTNVKIARSSSPTAVFTGAFSAQPLGSTLPFDFNIVLTAGEFVDFIVDNGNGAYLFDSTGLTASIVPVDNVITILAFGSHFQAGSATTLGVFKPFTSIASNSPVTGVITLNTPPVTFPNVLVALTPATYYPTSTPAVQQLPSELNVHPGDESSVVRFIAPFTGTYRVKGHFRTLDSQTTTSVGIPRASFSGTFASQPVGSALPFDVSVAVLAGDPVDFVVGNSNGSFLFDSTGLTASVVLTC